MWRRSVQLYGGGVMRRLNARRLDVLIAGYLITATCPAEPAFAYFDENTCTTLFAFDEVSIPHSQNLRLEMRAPQRHASNPVVARGAAGTPDSWGVQFYGSVIREGGKFR